MILHANNIAVIASGRAEPILHSSNLAIESGEFVILLGANGSGKSTLIKVLSGEITPSSGRVLMGGKSIATLSQKQKAIDFVTISQSPDDRLFTSLTLAENITLWESRFLKRSFAVLPAKFTSLMDQRLCNFSGGERQNILLHLAIAHPPKILFLDEHTSALDPKAAHEVMKLTAERVGASSIATVMVTHKLEDALTYGSRIIIMNEGRIIYDQKKDGSLTLSALKEMIV